MTRAALARVHAQLATSAGEFRSLTRSRLIMIIIMLDSFKRMTTTGLVRDWQGAEHRDHLGSCSSKSTFPAAPLTTAGDV